MNLHPECASTPCSKEHRCRPPEAVHISAGVDASQVPGVRLKPGYPSAAAGGASGVLRGRFGAAAAGGGVGVGAGNGGRAATAMATVEDPLNSEWHKLLVSWFSVIICLCEMLGCVSREYGPKCVQERVV